MSNFKELFKRYLWLIIFVGLLILGGLVFWIASDYQTSKFNNEVRQGQSTAQNAVQQAANAEKQADNFAVERAVEDGFREKVIQPKLEAARRQSAQSAQNLKVIKQKRNELEKNLHNISASRADNCAELHRLFPTEKFEYCHD